MKFIHIILLLTFASSLTACGNKGRLKTPDQIEKDNAKKAAKEAKEKQEEYEQP